MPLPLHAPQQDEQHKEDIACSLEGLTRLSPPTFPFIGTFVDHSLVLAAIDKDRLLKDLTLQNEAARFGYLETPLHQYQEMLFDFDGGPGVPQQWALLSGNLIRRLGACVNSAHEMVYAAFARGEESLTDFSADTLNHYNKVYYSSQSAFDDLPSLFTENEQVASAFAGYLQTELTNLEPRLLELCAGVNSLGRWNHYFSKIPQTHKATLFLADGSYGNSSQSLIPDISSNISLSTQPFNLLDDPRALINLGTFDRIFLCYGADSVWFPGDIQLIKNGGEWFQALTRVSVPDWHPKRELVIQAFKDLNGAKLEADDLGYLVFERLVVPFNVDALPMFREVADQRYANSKQATVVYPGGLSSWIEATVDAMCAAGGRLLIGDTGVYQPGNEYFYGFINTRGHAQARLVDFEILELLLNSRGYPTKLWGLSEFVATYADKWRYQTDSSQLASQFILEIGRRA